MGVGAGTMNGSQNGRRRRKGSSSFKSVPFFTLFHFQRVLKFTYEKSCEAFDWDRAVRQYPVFVYEAAQSANCSGCLLDTKTTY